MPSLKMPNTSDGPVRGVSIAVAIGKRIHHRA